MTAPALDRFGALYDAVLAQKRWLDDPTPLRYAASTLVTTPGDPADVAARLFALARDLKERAGWFGPHRGPLRFLIAAVLLRNGDGAAGFCRDVERIQRLFREARFRHGGIYEIMAFLILRQTDPDGIVDRPRVQRMRDLYREMNTHHWWLTGIDDYPACALLANRPGPVEALGRRIEAFYEGLLGIGWVRGNALQLASHILCLHPRPAPAVIERVRLLVEAFKEAGVRVRPDKYDEVSILAFADARPPAVVDKVLAGMEALRALRPRPDRATAFSLASSLALLELVQGSLAPHDVADLKALAELQAVIAAQEAAAFTLAASAAAGSAAASAAACSS